ncbi:hypothetical protein JAAARDRAFT_421321 [Jaapia argillacea MUCL 33604]|uniref:Uncharacterized protein n=1 Tax=Jaapia argillacea MUCL 33604 TaxID=933084 RepID=A0A067PFZ4_9AGAM|nr:hypothetical protein JAAARDRAFT_421321 [Jaapia argillacea MUCL 33604]
MWNVGPTGSDPPSDSPRRSRHDNLETTPYKATIPESTNPTPGELVAQSQRYFDDNPSGGVTRLNLDSHIFSNETSSNVLPSGKLTSVPVQSFTPRLLQVSEHQLYFQRGVDALDALVQTYFHGVTFTSPPGGSFALGIVFDKPQLARELDLSSIFRNFPITTQEDFSAQSAITHPEWFDTAGASLDPTAAKPVRLRTFRFRCQITFSYDAHRRK